MNNPIVSVVIPCYNNGHLLSKMIDCFLRQTLKDWELIIIDDCSTDNTQEIVKQYTQKDKRIKFYVRERKPKGAPTCRNIGMSKAQGKYLIIFDADDLILDTCLDNRVSFMETNPEIDYASFPATTFTDEQKLPHVVNKGIFGVENDNKDLLSRFLAADYPFTVWTNIYRKDAIIYTAWDEKINVYQDFDFIISGMLLALKHKFSNTKGSDYYYRQNVSNSISSNYISDEKCASTIYLFSKILDALKQHSDYERRKKEFIPFLVLHFERIVVSGNHKNTKIYIDFCKKYYTKSFILKLKITSKFALHLKNIVLRMLLLYFFTAILFCRNQSTLMLCSKLKRCIRMIY